MCWYQIAKYQLKDFDAAVNAMLLAVPCWDGVAKATGGGAGGGVGGGVEGGVGAASGTSMGPVPSPQVLIPRKDSLSAAAHLLKLGVRIAIAWVQEVHTLQCARWRDSTQSSVMIMTQ